MFLFWGAEYMLCTNDGRFVALCYALHTAQQIKREDFDQIGTHTLPPWPIGVDQIPRRVIFIDFPHIRSQRPTKRARNASHYQVLWHAAPWCGCPTFGFHCWPRSLFQAWTVDKVENPGKSECLLVSAILFSNFPFVHRLGVPIALAGSFGVTVG